MAHPWNISVILNIEQLGNCLIIKKGSILKYFHTKISFVMENMNFSVKYLLQLLQN